MGSERHARGGPAVSDSLTCWLLDVASTQPLREVISR